MTNVQLFQEIADLPDDLKKRVEEFVADIKKQNNQKKTTLKERKFGYAPGFFTMKEDFDDPIEDFKNYM